YTPLVGNFIIATTPTLMSFTFTYLPNIQIHTGYPSLDGNATPMVQAGNLARAIGTSTAFLAFATVGATPQAIIDYTLNNLNQQISIANNGGDTNIPISVSTQDNNP